MQRLIVGLAESLIGNQSRQSGSAALRLVASCNESSVLVPVRRWARGYSDAKAPSTPPAPSSAPQPAAASPGAPTPAASSSSEQRAAEAVKGETSTAEAGAEAMNPQQKEMAARVSSFMFPWERHQFENAGKPLRTWEKVYWWGFMTVLAWFLFTTSQSYFAPAPEDEAKKQRVHEARLKFADASMRPGGSFLGENPYADDSDDPFEGLTPSEVQQFVWKNSLGLSEEQVAALSEPGADTGALLGRRSGSDKWGEDWRRSLPTLSGVEEYEGLSPREIDAMEEARRGNK